MEHIAGLDVVPRDISIAAISRHHAKTGTIGFIPNDRQSIVCHPFKVPHCWQIHKDHIVSRDVEIVNHGGAWHFYFLNLNQLAVFRHAIIGQIRWRHPVAKGQHFPGLSTDFWMRRHRAGKLPPVVMWTHRFKII